MLLSLSHSVCAFWCRLKSFCQLSICCLLLLCGTCTKLTDGTELYKWQSLIGCWQAEDSTYPGCELEQAMINTRWPPKMEQIFQCHWTVLYLLVVSYNLSRASQLHCCIMQGDQQTMEQVVESLASLCRKVYDFLRCLHFVHLLSGWQINALNSVGKSGEFLHSAGKSCGDPGVVVIPLTPVAMCGRSRLSGVCIVDFGVSSLCHGTTTADALALRNLCECFWLPTFAKSSLSRYLRTVRSRLYWWRQFRCL